MSAPSITLRYAARRQRAEVDVWLPPEGRSHPSVLLVHGGGFLGGHKRMRATWVLAGRLAAAGYAVAAPDYRLFLRGGRVAEGVEDVVHAMAWWRARAHTWDADPARTSVVGVSAGGALVTLAADRLGPIDALVGVYGLYDFTNVLGRPRLTVLPRLMLRTWDRARWTEASPVARYTASVPTLLVHGTADRLVPIAHTEALAAARRARGLPVEVRRYEGAGHGFLRHPELPVTDRCVADVLDFLGAPRRAAA